MTRLRPECADLAAELRALRARAGITLAALAAKSTYSKSSWERYLNGKALPPWAAIRELCAVADEPPPRMRALWELAESAWSGRASVASPSPPVAAPAAEPRRETAVPPERGAVPDRAWTRTPARPLPNSGVAIAVVAVLLCVVATTGAAYAWRSAVAARSSDSPGGALSAAAVVVRCHGRTCQGRDPGTMECGVAPATLAQVTTPSAAGLQIRYNPQCEGAWARAWHTRVGDRISITAPREPTPTARVADAYTAQSFAYTPMVAVTVPHGTLRACLLPAGHGAPECVTARTP